MKDNLICLIYRVHIKWFKFELYKINNAYYNCNYFQDFCVSNTTNLDMLYNAINMRNARHAR